MDNKNPKKSKAFIITFILILLLLVAGYYFFKNREQYFGAKGSLSISKVFSPLLGSSKSKDVKVIDTTPTTPAVVTTPAVKKRAGIVITDVNGNKVVRAEAGENLKKGDVLYIAGFNKNDDPIVMKAIANDKNKSLVFGVAGQDMTKGAMLDVIIEGILSGVPTNRKEGTFWIANNPLYLSDKIYGGMTKNAPTLPSFVVPVGSVIKVDAVNGSIRIGDLVTNKDARPGSMSTLQKNTLNSLNTKLLNLLSTNTNPNTNTNLSDEQKNNIRSLSSGILSALNSNISLSNGQMNMINNLNAQVLNDIPMDMIDYWSSIFGPISFNTNTPTNGENGSIIPGMPPLNSITLPGYNPNQGNSNNPNNPNSPNTNTNNPANTNNGANQNNPADANNGADTTLPNTNVSANAITTTNSCSLIEKNPLVFTADEQARLDVLLRKFYLISSTLRTADDITAIYNEVDQQKNFVNQIKELTKQCYVEAPDAVLAKNNWVRHGNPWYTKTACGTFPYTDKDTGYLDYSLLPGGATPEGFKVISGYYYGTLATDITNMSGSKTTFAGITISDTTTTTTLKAGESCDKFNNFGGYGLKDQINNVPACYLGHYPVENGKYQEANNCGYPGDSISGNITDLSSRQPNQKILEAGCNWKDGVILDNTERILNIW